MLKHTLGLEHSGPACGMCVYIVCVHVCKVTTHSLSALVNLVESCSNSLSDSSGHSSFSIDCRGGGHMPVT